MEGGAESELVRNSGWGGVHSASGGGKGHLIACPPPREPCIDAIPCRAGRVSAPAPRPAPGRPWVETIATRGTRCAVRMREGVTPARTSARDALTGLPTGC